MRTRHGHPRGRTSAALGRFVLFLLVLILVSCIFEFDASAPSSCPSILAELQHAHLSPRRGGRAGRWPSTRWGRWRDVDGLCGARGGRVVPTRIVLGKRCDLAGAARGGGWARAHQNAGRKGLRDHPQQRARWQSLASAEGEGPGGRLTRRPRRCISGQERVHVLVPDAISSSTSSIFLWASAV